MRDIADEKARLLTALNSLAKSFHGSPTEVYQDAATLCPMINTVALNGVPGEWVGFEELRGFVNRHIHPLFYAPPSSDDIQWPPSSGIVEEFNTLVRKFAGKRSRRRAIAIIAEDELILAAMADAYPAAVNQLDLSGLTGLPRQKISERLAWLEAKPRRYVERPEGTQRKGRAITPAGLSAIGRPVEGPH